MRGPAHDFQCVVAKDRKGHGNIDDADFLVRRRKLLPERPVSEPVGTDALQPHPRRVPLNVMIDPVLAGRGAGGEARPDRTRREVAPGLERLIDAAIDQPPEVWQLPKLVRTRSIEAASTPSMMSGVRLTTLR